VFQQFLNEATRTAEECGYGRFLGGGESWRDARRTGSRRVGSVPRVSLRHIACTTSIGDRTGLWLDDRLDVLAVICWNGGETVGGSDSAYFARE
jgi:hypothetical protein